MQLSQIIHSYIQRWTAVWCLNKLREHMKIISDSFQVSVSEFSLWTGFIADLTQGLSNMCKQWKLTQLGLSHHHMFFLCIWVGSVAVGCGFLNTVISVSTNTLLLDYELPASYFPNAVAGVGGPLDCRWWCGCCVSVFVDGTETVSQIIIQSDVIELCVRFDLK